MAQPQPTADAAFTSGRIREVRPVVIRGVEIALILSVAVGAAEWGLSLFHIHNQFGEGPWPWGLLIGALGRGMLTHALVWCPLLAFLGFWLPRGWRDQDAGVLAGVGVLLSGVLAVYADGQLTGLARGLPLIVAYALVVILAVGTGWALRKAFDLLGRKRARTAIHTAGAVSVVILLAGTACLALTSWWRFDGVVPDEPKREGTTPASRRPHVLWIVLDTVRADRMGIYEPARSTTPHLDEWANQALVYEHASGNAIWTVPSHASKFTGLGVRGHGMDFFHLALDPQHVTLAERLKASGYATACFTNNPWISRQTGLARGFDTCWLMHSVMRMERMSIAYALERWGVAPIVPWLDPDTGAAVTNAMVRDWLDRKEMRSSSASPVFLFVNYMEAHSPYRVPRAYREAYLQEDEVARSYRLRWHPYGHLPAALSVKANVEGLDTIAAADRALLGRQYDAAVAYLDARVDELLSIFASRDMLDDTLVIISSDHGEYLGEHGMWDHRYLTYEPVRHVALMVREPGRTAGKRIATPVQPSDVYHTVLGQVLGEQAPPPVGPGRDLIELAQASPAERFAVTEYNGPTPTKLAKGRIVGEPAGDARDDPQIAISDGRWKYMRSVSGRRELFDLADDPGELRDRAADYPQHVARLVEALAAWEASVPAHEYSADDAATEMDAATRDALKNLGYLGGD